MSLALFKTMRSGAASFLWTLLPILFNKENTSPKFLAKSILNSYFKVKLEKNFYIFHTNVDIGGSSGGHLVQLPSCRTITSTRPSQPLFCLVKSWKLSGIDIPPPLWVSCTTLQRAKIIPDFHSDLQSHNFMLWPFFLPLEAIEKGLASSCA